MDNYRWTQIKTRMEDRDDAVHLELQMPGIVWSDLAGFGRRGVLWTRGILKYRSPPSRGGDRNSMVPRWQRTASCPDSQRSARAWRSGGSSARDNTRAAVWDKPRSGAERRGAGCGICVFILRLTWVDLG
jgi:hypothetical protein